MAATEPRSPAALLVDLSNAHVLARCLHVIAEFGVADALGEDAASAAKLASRCGLEADALERMLRLVAAHGVFEASPLGYRHNAASRLLRGDHPETLRPLVRMRGSAAMWGGVTELGHAARTGKPSRDWAALVEYFAAHPEEAAVFNEAMIAKSQRVVPAVLDAYDFGAFAVVADVGGGRGHLLQAILARCPGTAGVLFEMPHVVREVAGIESTRLALAAGDVFADPLPSADAYVLMDVLHDWADEDAAAILAAVRRAAPAHARVLIVETLVAEAPGPQIGKTLDVTMLAVTGGRERTPTEHGALLAAAGLRMTRVVPTASHYSVLEAVVA